MRQRSIVSIAVLAIAFAAGCARKSNDAALVTNIKAQMFSDPQLKDSDLQVAAVNGEVTLSGTVPNAAAHLEAYKIATQTAGVVRVNDKISVDEALAAPAPSQAAPPPPKPQRASEQKAAPREDIGHREHPRRSHTRPQDMEAAENSEPPAEPDEDADIGADHAQQPPSPEDAAPDTGAEAPAATAAPAAPPAPQPQQLRIPAGTNVAIRMIDGVDSSVNQAGEIFHASLDQPLVAGSRVAVPKGADVYVRLVSASAAGKMTGKSELQLQLVKLEFQGESYPLVSSTYTLNGSSRGKDTAKKVGVGAVLGTLIGAIAGGGKGAAIGAGVGAAGGGAYQEATHGQQVKIPSETKLDFQLQQPVTVTIVPPLGSQ